jgi:hypothetical protein
MIHKDNLEELDWKDTVKFCPYKGEYEWLIECTKSRCMKYDSVKNECTRT